MGLFINFKLTYFNNLIYCSYDDSIALFQYYNYEFNSVAVKKKKMFRMLMAIMILSTSFGIIDIFIGVNPTMGLYFLAALMIVLKVVIVVAVSWQLSLIYLVKVL